MRVTAQEVKEIIETNLSDSRINTFITAANAIITAKISQSPVLSDTLIKEIERWLSAHLITIYKQAGGSEASGGIVRFERVGETAVGYDMSSKKMNTLNLENTEYGRQVVMLDITGTLANLGKRKARMDTLQMRLE